MQRFCAVHRTPRGSPWGPIFRGGNRIVIRKVAVTFALCLMAASAAQAQDPRVEISGTAGWTFSDGVNVGSIDDSPIEVGPKDAFSWGARLGFNLSPNVELGFLLRLAVDGPRGHGRRQPEHPADRVQLPRLLRLQLRRHRRRGPALRPGRPGRDAVRQPRHRRGEHRRRDAVLDHLGGRPEAVPGQERSASVSRLAGRPRTSRRTPRATGATPTGAATRSGTPSTRTSSSSPAGSSSASNGPVGPGGGVAVTRRRPFFVSPPRAERAPLP